MDEHFNLVLRVPKAILAYAGNVTMLIDGELVMLGDLLADWGFSWPTSLWAAGQAHPDHGTVEDGGGTNFGAPVLPRVIVIRQEGTPGVGNNTVVLFDADDGFEVEFITT